MTALVYILLTQSILMGMSYISVSAVPPPVGGPGDIVPGGIGQCQAITSFHKKVANFAVQNMGTGYTLHQIVGVREQIVAGTMYHMELHVCTKKSGTHYKYCHVKVVHRPFESPKFIMHSNSCTDTCLKSKKVK